MRKFILLLAAGAFAASALAGPGAKKTFHDGKKHWVINVGLFQGQGDLKDAGVDTGFTGSVDYCFGGNGTNTTYYAGLGGFFGDGDGDFKFRAYGVHVGAFIGLGAPGDDNPWAIDIRAGWYQSRVEDTLDVSKAGSEDVDDKEDGFGGSIAVVYQGKSGPRFSLGWFMAPEIGNSDINGYFFTIGFPIGK